MRFNNFYRIQKQASLRKQAGPYGDALLGALVGQTPIVGPAANLGGFVAGLMKPTPTEEQENDMDKKLLYSLIPGVGAYREAQRMKRQTRADDGSQRHLIAQQLGPVTAALLPTGAGAGIGAGIGGMFGGASGAGIGAVIGAGMGAGSSLAATLLAAALAAGRRTRTKEEQRAYANSDTAIEYFVPGVAAYNAWKSYGRSHADAVEREMQRAVMENGDPTRRKKTRPKTGQA